jgi:osmoprotectant transport system ATP-binding protein
VLEQYDTPARILAQPASPFVGEFLGPDRGQKRLSVVPIDPSRLEPPASDGARGGAEVASTATLADALSTMLLHDVDRVRVNRNGEVLGVLTLHSLMETATADRSG